MFIKFRISGQKYRKGKKREKCQPRENQGSLQSTVAAKWQAKVPIGLWWDVLLEQENNRQLSDHSDFCQDFWPQQFIGSMYGESVPISIEQRPEAKRKVDRKESFALILFQGV